MRKKRILIAEDEPDVLQGIIAAILRKRRNRYEPVACIDGIEAFELVKTHQIDLLILDLRMENMDGIQLLQQMLKDPSLRIVPILVSSGYLDDSMIEQLKSLGVCDCLKKPYSMDFLINKIDLALLIPA